MRYADTAWSTCIGLLLAVSSWACGAQILIGQTAGITGPVAATVKESVQGARLYIDSINAKGGINGEKIELIPLDDKFDVDTAAENARVLIEEKGVMALFMNLSNNASSGFIRQLGNASRGVIVTQVFPYERSYALPFVKEAMNLAKAKGVSEVSPAMLEGFAAAKVLVEGLRRASPHPSREKIISALEGMKKFDLGGLDVSYSPTNHTGLDFADLSIIGSAGKFQR